MKGNLKSKIVFCSVIVIILTLLFFIGPYQIGVNRVSAQSYPTLKVRVRYSDGSSAEGIKVELYREDMGLPDIYERDCLVPRSGFCEFTLKSGLTYIIKFPNRQKLDPITAYAAGHSGLDGMGIVLTENYTMGFVLSKLVDEEEDANWMLLDLTPEEQTPLPRIPEGAVEEARKLLEEDQPAEPVETYPTVTPAPTIEQIQITAPTIAVPRPAEEELEEISPTDIELIDEEDLQNASEGESAEAVENAPVSEANSDSRLRMILIILSIALALILCWIIVTLRGMKTSGSKKG